MSNAVGYVLTNFVWFGELVSAFFTPRFWSEIARTDVAGLVLLAGAGAIAFALGVLLTVVQSNRRPYLILASFLLSVVVVGLSAAFRGKLNEVETNALMLALTFTQVAIAMGALYWARNGRAATFFMMPLSAAFWLWSALDATMSFQDVWL